MNENTSFSNNVDTLFSDLQTLTKTDTVMGTPITVEDKTLIPLMSVTLGYGSTGMGTKAQMGGSMSSETGGHGLGAKVSASGVIIIEKDKDSIQYLSTSENGAMSQMMSKIPQALSNIGQNMMGVGSQGQQQGNTQNQQGGQQAGQQGSQVSQ